MPKPSDVMMAETGNRQQYYLSKFLKVKPMALGILEILIALLGLGLTIWNNRFFLLWAPIFYMIIGVVTVSAAHTGHLCLVKSSQIFSYLNLVVAAFSFCFHLIFSWGVSCFILVSCDLLILIFSVAIDITTCYCCCNPKQRTDLNTDLPVNHIVVMCSPNSSAMAQPISPVLYVLPAADGQAPPTLLTNWGLYAPSPNYSAVSTTPPPTYDQVSAALLPNNRPVPSAPPPPYEYEDLQARR